MAKKKGTTLDQDIETARQFYEELLAMEVRMWQANKAMYNRGFFVEATQQMYKVRESLQRFIGKRMSDKIFADIDAKYDEALTEAQYDPLPGAENER